MRLLIVSALAYFEISFGCLCGWPRPGPDVIYCEKDHERYLIRANITSEKIPVDDTMFTDFYHEIQLLSEIHTLTALSDTVDTTRVYTAHDHALCGIDLTQDEYLLIEPQHSTELED